MKKTLLFYFLVLSSVAVNAQQDLAKDQNPNFKASLDKYTADKENIIASMNTTVQNTYKAYDWYELKQERKQFRIADRRERRLYELQNYGNYYNPYNYNFDPFAAPYRYPQYGFHYGWRRWHY